MNADSKLKVLFVIALVLAVGLVGFTQFERKRLAASSGLAVNAKASEETKRLLQFLYDIKGQYTLTGQHSFIEKPDLYADRVWELTGQYPALKGYEMGGILGQTDRELMAERAKVAKSAIAWHQSGGIVTMTYHVHLPGDCACWKSVNNGGITTEQFEEIITPGTEAYKQHIADLDATAVYLKKLRDAGVPVLWRPYHEMNGGWFWWGKQTRFVELWNIMYDRFTRVHKLNNLLWVWTAATPDEWADPFEPYYVGDSRADILAIDIYHNQYKQKYYDRLKVLAGDKPIAIGENGELPSASQLQGAQKSYVWFMTWGDMLEKNNSLDHIRDLYDQKHIVTREELGELRQ